jgi:hypothetical protein
MKALLTIVMASISLGACGVSAGNSSTAASAKPALSCVQDGADATTTFTISGTKGTWVTAGKMAHFISQMEFKCGRIYYTNEFAGRHARLWSCTQVMAGIPTNELSSVEVVDNSGAVSAIETAPNGDSNQIDGCTLN